MKKFRVIASMFVAAVLTMPLSLLADEHEEQAAPATLHEVWFVVPKTGMEGKFSEAVEGHMAFRAENGDTRAWQAYNVVYGDDMAPFQFRSCCFEWADMDDQVVQERERGFDAHWNENVHQYVDHYHHHIERMDVKHSHWPDGQGNGPYYGVTTWKAIEGAGPASGKARKKMSKVALKEGWASDDTNWLWLFRETGKGKTMLVSSFDDFADMTPPEQNFYEFMAEKVGAEKAAAIFDDFSSAYSSSDYTIWVRNDALSASYDDE